MERLEIIEDLKHLPDTLRTELGEAVTLQDALNYRPAEGEWSVRDTLGHLRDAAEIWHKRLYQVWAQNDPVLMDWDAYLKSHAREGSVEERYANTNASTLIDEIESWRAQTVGLLMHAVDWTRIGQWKGEGRRTLKQLAEYLVAHDADHVAQIRTLLSSSMATHST